MADRLDGLRDKYRVAARDRLSRICQLLREAEGPKDVRLTEAMAELHAVKGESSMVGFEAMSRLSHTLESYVAYRRSSAEASYLEVANAVDSLVSVFDQNYAQLTDDPSIEELMSELSAALPADNMASQAPRRTAEPPEHKGAARKPGRESAASPTPDVRARYTRIDAKRVDELCDAIAEAILHLGGIEAEFAQVVGLLTHYQNGNRLASLRQKFTSVRSEFNDVAASAWALRLVSVAPRLEELAQYAATLAKSLNKDVQIEVEAGGVELERNVLDELAEPLMHIVRNAIDHGIERPSDRGVKQQVGRLRCSAESRGSSAVLLIEDDGAGLNATAIRDRAVGLGLVSRERASFLADADAFDLIFLENFTQRDVVTAISGRGIGLSAARRKVEAIGGAIRVESTPGQGTRFEILVPSTLSRERVLLVEAANTRCCIPARWAKAVVTDSRAVAEAKSKHYTNYGGRLVVVRSVADWLALPCGNETALVVVEIAGRDGAFLVDRVLGESDILRLSADAMLSLGQRIEASGTTEDGEVVLFLRWAEALRANPHRRGEALESQVKANKSGTVLVVDDSPVIRDIVSELLVNAGLKVLTAENGRFAIQVLNSHSCDLVISDVEMPELSGLELLEHIRKTNDTLPVVMLTTRSSPESRRKAASLGANAYVVKSEFRGSILLDVVRQFVELPA